MKPIVLTALAASLALGACARADDVDTDNNATTEAKEAALEAQTDDFIINAEDFGREQLGAKIEGPAGPEVEGSLVMADGTSIGDIRSYVACPENISVCDPAKLPEGTIYTYVHVVTPGVDEPNDDAIAQPKAIKPVAKSVTFRTDIPAHGFSGQAGYSLEQARAALGPQGTFTVTCNEGKLVWDVASGEFWGTGEPVTFFWKSTIPPEGPQNAYGFDADGFTGKGTGPFPAAAQGKETGCT